MQRELTESSARQTEKGWSKDKTEWAREMILKKPDERGKLKETKGEMRKGKCRAMRGEGEEV